MPDLSNLPESQGQRVEGGSLGLAGGGGRGDEIIKKRSKRGGAIGKVFERMQVV